MFVEHPPVPATSHAIVLAAGRGSRLQPDEDYKLLVEIDGVPMLDRHLAHFERLGVRHVTVVTGYRHRPLGETVATWETDTDIELHVAVNPAFDAGNGLSVLAGIDHARSNEAIEGADPFWLTMSDHLFEATLFERLSDRIDEPERPDEAGLEGMLVVDSKIETIYDLADANKVRTTGRGELEAIGKELVEFDVVDAGLFWCGGAFVDALEAERESRGDCSTSDAVRRLAEAGSFGLFDLGEARWQDVDTPGAREYAEKLVE